MAAVDLAQLATGWAESSSADLQGLLGCPVELVPVAEKAGPRDALLGAGVEGGWVHAVLRTRDDAREPVHALAPVATARALAEARLGHPPESEAFEGEVEEAFVEAIELCAGCLGRQLAELGGLPGLEHEASAPLASPLADDAALGAGDYRGLWFSLALGGREAGELRLLIPEERATAWFGPPDEDAVADLEPLVVIDPDPERRAAAEALAEPLGRVVWTLDPAEFGPHSFDELSETGAVIVAWDLGGVVGLDLLEELRRDPRTARLTLALATTLPTRHKALMALRWGARSLFHLPLDPGEVARRLSSS